MSFLCFCREISEGHENVRTKELLCRSWLGEGGDGW